MKYDWKFKLDCVIKHKEGRRDFVPAARNKKSILNHVSAWVKAFDDLGVDGLKHNSKNRDWTAGQRFELVAKVLAGNSLTSVAKDAHIDSGQLCQWVKRYRERGMDGFECSRKGRPPKGGFSVDIMSKKKIELPQTEQEELKSLRERNKYLEVENLYLKKLRALELEKTAKLAKAKKQGSSKPSKKKPNAA